MKNDDIQKIISYLRIIILLLLLRMSPNLVDTASKVITYFETGFDIGIAELPNCIDYNYVQPLTTFKNV